MNNYDNFSSRHICTYLQCNSLGDNLAPHWIYVHQERADYNFNDLDQESSRFSKVQSIGFSAGVILFNFLSGLKQGYVSSTLKTKVQESLVELFTKQYEMVMLFKAQYISKFHIINKTGIPEKKSKPDKIRIVINPSLLALISSCWFIPTFNNFQRMVRIRNKLNSK